MIKQQIFKEFTRIIILIKLAIVTLSLFSILVFSFAFHQIGEKHPRVKSFPNEKKSLEYSRKRVKAYSHRAKAKRDQRTIVRYKRRNFNHQGNFSLSRLLDVNGP